MIALAVLGRVVLFACVGACVGLLAAWLTGMSRWPPPGSARLPYPHVVPKSRDVVALRFAMVHDVVHERFARHSLAYYKERNRRARQALASLKEKASGPAPRYYALLDDLAVGLELAGEHDEAIQVMRDKLRTQTERAVPRLELYATHANLGTFLILGPFRKIRPGNEEDKKTLREGLKHIRTAIEINPDSHFGREIWQAVLIEYMLALYDNPELLLRFDMVGNRLDLELDGLDQHPLGESASGPKKWKGNLKRWGANYGGVAKARGAAAYLADPSTWEQHRSARGWITTVGAESGWTEAVKCSHREPVPFDEPVLGIVGMWRLGGGAHPFFAVALGETLLRVGQRYLAWNAFERAGRLAPLAWPDPQLQKRFTDHCRSRQAAIQGTLSSREVAQLTPAFEADLARGQEYQKAYHRYEEEQIAAGKSIEDPQFHDDFHASHPAIASPVGDADWFSASETWMPGVPALAALLGAGVFALAAALWLPPRRS